ncbi:MAG TPA: DUF429 domain-containing protein [Thermoanaerobaculaceae bacterium]|nr:DUF429 domain-containing protein [Thermoanaerobaculaceae bacterium]
MRTLGIDLASDPRKTAVCRVRWGRGAGVVDLLQVGAGDGELLDAHAAADATGIDSPFGWPAAFLAFLCGTSRLAADPLPWTGDHVRGLRYRATDLAVRELTGRWPLSVSSDLIAVVAMRCQGLLAGMGVRDRSGDGRVFEVYPAAALRRWGLQSTRYKGRAGRPVREEIVAALRARARWLQLSPAHASQLVESDDALDALVAALSARAAAVGLTVSPREEQRHEAAREGWIAVPVEGSLERLPTGRVHARRLARRASARRPTQAG